MNKRNTKESLEFRGSLVPRQYLLLLAILAAQFLICLWLLDKRWINPDEGAHIMDGRLALSGLVPEVDYGSRQVLYVYVIALFLKIFGIGYLGVRLLPLISTIGVSLLVFFISKKLFNQKVALLASGIYAFLPLSIIESTIVKTEPLTTLLSCAGIYLVVSGVKSERRATPLFFLSGVFFSLAYYVRESSLAIPVAIFLFFAIIYWGRFQRLFKNYGLIVSGYLFVCLIIVALYSRLLAPSQIWHNSVNPLNLSLESLQKIFGSFTSQEGAAIGSLEFPNGSQPWNITVYYLRLTLFANFFLLAGFLFSIFILAFSFLTRRSNEDFKEISLPFSLLYSWLFSLALSYSYWMFNRGFFIQYFEEFLPPLSILLAFVIIYSLTKLELERNLVKGIAAVSLFLLIVFFFNREVSGFQIKSVTYFLITALALAFFYFSPRLRLQRWLYVVIAIGVISAILFKPAYLPAHFIKVLPYLILPAIVCLVAVATSDLKLGGFKKGLSFIFSFLLISSFVLTFAFAGRNMGTDFDSVWSPETVKETSDFIDANSKENDEVISGAVIWELEADRKPFMNHSHPLDYMFGVSGEKLQKMNWYLSDHPPRFIILDGYTEQTYLNHTNKLQTVMDEKYRLKKVVNGSRYPVKIYEFEAESEKQVN